MNKKVTIFFIIALLIMIIIIITNLIFNHINPWFAWGFFIIIIFISPRIYKQITKINK